MEGTNFRDRLWLTDGATGSVCRVTCFCVSSLAYWRTMMYYQAGILCHLERPDKAFVFRCFLWGADGVGKWMTIPCGSSRWQERQVNYSLTAAVGPRWPVLRELVDVAKVRACRGRRQREVCETHWTFFFFCKVTASRASWGLVVVARRSY